MIIFARQPAVNLWSGSSTFSTDWGQGPGEDHPSQCSGPPVSNRIALARVKRGFRSPAETYLAPGGRTPQNRPNSYLPVCSDAPELGIFWAGNSEKYYVAVRYGRSRAGGSKPAFRGFPPLPHLPLGVRYRKHLSIAALRALELAE